MPTTFGTASVQVGLIDPLSVRRDRERFRRESIPELRFANGFYCPLHRQPARGWILITKNDYLILTAQVNSSLSPSIQPGYATNFQLQLDDFNNPPLTFYNLSIVQARCVSTGIASDPNAIYLVELTDQRGILGGRFFSMPVVRYYNVLAPAYPGNYYELSLNGGTAHWTWEEMIDDLWLYLGAFLGSPPALPSTPCGVPNNWNLDGVSAWQALCDMLDLLGMAVSVDLTQAQQYNIVQRGSADVVFDALVFNNSPPQDDIEWIDVGSGRVPGSMIVYFRRVNEFYGTEETIRLDDFQWATSPLYSVLIDAPETFTGAQGTGFIWDDFPVRFDIDGNPLSADVTQAAEIAQERVTQYYQRIYDATLGFMNQTYAGALPFYAGAKCDGVCWRQDYQTHDRLAWTTQILRGRLWSEIYPQSEAY